MQRVSGWVLAVLLGGSLGVSLGVPATAAAQEGDVVAIRGATVMTAGPAGTIERGLGVVRDGRIVAVGADVAVPEGRCCSAP